MSTLTKIQNELKIGKTKYNAYGKYNYRSLEDILDAVKPILLKHNAVLTLTDVVHDSNLQYIEAIATLSVGESDTYMTKAQAGIDAKGGMNLSQAFGAASSYARKYALGGLFLIDDNQDADATNKHEKETTKELDVKEIKTKIKECKSIKELTTLFNSNKAIGLNLDLMADFSYQKEIIQSQM